MRLILAFLLAFTVCSAYAKSGNCKDFVVWNPATKDTLMHFHRNASDPMTKDGGCYFNSGWTAKVIKWHCKNMYITQDGKSTFHSNHEGSMSLKPYHFYCQSFWSEL